MELGSPWRTCPRSLEDNVWIIGHPAQKNFGALAYFIELPGGGVLVDVPKPGEELFRWLEEHGGVRLLFLTHRDRTQREVGRSLSPVEPRVTRERRPGKPMKGPRPRSHVAQ